MKGAPLVLAPSRDLLVVTGDQDPEGIAIMLGLGARAAATARAIAAPVYRLEHGAWVAFRAPPTDPVLTAIAKWNTEAWVGLYADQKEPLQAAVGDDVFVATLTGYEDQAGRPFTLAVWTQGLTTLLPRADLVGIVRMEQHPGAEPTGSVVGFVRWDKLVAVLGPRLAPAGTTPERWRVSAVASDDDLRRLAVEAAPSALAP
ncbi:MAG: hypothetical protein U1F43_01350 [Myxococcota bacterium]